MFPSGLALLAIFFNFVAFASANSGEEANSSSKTFIVTLKQNSTISSLGNNTLPHSAHELPIINGFIVNASDTSIEKIRSHPHVLQVEEDKVMNLTYHDDDDDYVTRRGTPWGLERLNRGNYHTLSKDPDFLHFEYTYNRKAGHGVDIYVLDSGVRITHEEFGGRARWGATFGPYQDIDDNGHGTHCAATAAGHQYGVAKRSNIIAVKAFDYKGDGFKSDILAGMNWIYQDHLKHPWRPAVASMSFGGPVSVAIDEAVSKLTFNNIHTVVAAGNCPPGWPCSHLAKNYSPARVPGVITVGAHDINDARPEFSNYGPEVDIHAPGVNVISAWSTSNTATNTISGTSMATPHVAGLVAYLISLQGDLSTFKMAELVKSWGLQDNLSNIPSGTTNLMAHMKLFV